MEASKAFAGFSGPWEALGVGISMAVFVGFLGCTPGEKTGSAASKSPDTSPTSGAVSGPGGATPGPGSPVATSKQLPGTGPAPRTFSALALDSAGARLLLFGGKDSKGKALGDTWIYDLKGGAWRQGKAGPPRWGFGTIYDATRKQLVAFGGEDPAFLNDTWTYDPEKDVWAEVQIAGDKPGKRYGHSTAYDTKRGRMVVSHGFAEVGGRFNDTWALDLSTSTWKNLTPPGDKPVNRCLHDAAIDQLRDTMYFFGGCASGFGGCPLNDLWEFNLDAGKWTQLNPTDLPKARTNMSLVVGDGGRVILYGGSGGDDVQTFDPKLGGWQRAGGVSPGARSEHDAVYDATTKKIYVFGGTRESVALADLWEFSL